MAYGGNDHRGELANVINWVFTAVCFVVFLLRIISRSVLTRQFGLDDAFMVASMAMLISTVSVMSAGISRGYGKHIWDLSPEQSVEAGKYGVIVSALIVNTFAWPKLAIVALLQRIFVFGRLVSVVFWTLNLGLVFCCLLLSIFWWVQCTPRAHQWDPVNVPGSCWNPEIVQDLSYFVAAFSVFLDFMAATYPLLVVRRLNMTLGKKIVVCGTMSGGYAAGIICMYKITTISEIGRAAKNDPTWAEIPLLIWTIVEAATLMIMACLPTIGPFIRLVSGSRGLVPGRQVQDDRLEGQWPRPARKDPHFETLASKGSNGEAVTMVEMNDQHKAKVLPGPGEILKTVEITHQHEPVQ